MSDIVEGMFYIFEYFKKSGEIYDVYNFGNDDWIIVKEIVEIVSEEMGLSLKFCFIGGVDGGRGWKGDVKFMFFDIGKVKFIGWRLKMNSYEVVRRMVKEFFEG